MIGIGAMGLWLASGHGSELVRVCFVACLSSRIASVSTATSKPVCPFCQGKTNAPAYGQEVTCPHCGSHFRTRPPAKALWIVLGVFLALAGLVVLTIILL